MKEKQKKWQLIYTRLNPELINLKRIMNKI